MRRQPVGGRVISFRLRRQGSRPTEHFLIFRGYPGALPCSVFFSYFIRSALDFFRVVCHNISKETVYFLKVTFT